MVPISYNVRSLAARRTTTAAAALGVGAVVFVFSSVLMLANGVERTLGRSGSDEVALVMRDGADAELSSGISEEDAAMVRAAPQVRQRSGGKADAASEVVAVLAMEKVGDAGFSNVQVRGVRDDVFSFRSTARIVEGRAARPGADEVVIGRAIAGRFEGVSFGQSFELRRNRPVKVVGVFEDGGSSYESEVWADIETTREAFGRQGLVSAVRVRLRSTSDFDAFRANIEGNRQLDLQVLREDEYYRDQSEGTALFIKVMGILIASLFSLAAMIGAMITMYSAVASRIREIGALRALGFSRFNILLSFLLEAVLLTLLGGLMGVLASLGMGLVEFSIVNFASWSEIVFRFEPTPSILMGSFFMAGALGILGGFLPAIRAARTPILEALRAA